MKNIFILLILISSTGWGQGLAVTVFIPGQGWVSKNIYDVNNPPTALTAPTISSPTLTSPTITGTLTLPAAAIAWSKLVGTDAVLTESQVTNLSTDLGNKQGISAGATSATTGTMTVTMTSATQNVFTITPTGACTFNASGGKAGASATFIVTTSGASSFVLTWGTNFKTTATLATGVTTAKTFAVNFICTNGTQWIETGRTIAQ